MTVLSIILGVVLIAGGFSYMFTPLHTFITVGYFSVILIVAFGVIGIIRAIAAKRFGVNFVFSILSIVLGIIMLVYPGSYLLAQTVSLMMTAVWLIVMGILTIVDAVKVKKMTGSKIWILLLIFGIISIVIGGCSFFSPIYLAITIGVMIGVFFIETGFTLILSAVAARE